MHEASRSRRIPAQRASRRHKAQGHAVGREPREVLDPLRKILGMRGNDVLEVINANVGPKWKESTLATPAGETQSNQEHAIFFGTTIAM